MRTNEIQGRHWPLKFSEDTRIFPSNEVNFCPIFKIFFLLKASKNPHFWKLSEAMSSYAPAPLIYVDLFNLLLQMQSFYVVHILSIYRVLHSDLTYIFEWEKLSYFFINVHIPALYDLDIWWPPKAETFSLYSEF